MMMRKLVLVFLAVSIMLPSTGLVAAEAEDIVYSALFPGLGQYRTGRYTRGTLLFGMEIVALGWLGVADIQYDRKVEVYDHARIMYENASYIGDAQIYHSQMVEAWDDADNLNNYRKMLVGAAIGVWVVGVADMIWGPEAEVPLLTFEPRQDGFMICRTFTF